MKTNKVIARILLIVMILTVVSSSVGFAEGEVFKDETVYVNLDNGGKDLNKSSSVWLHSETPLNKLEDKSILKEVINVKGDEEPKIGNGKITWETDKKDIYYQGEVTKELPIKPNIKYYLDGKEIDADSIAGESGEVKITIDIENLDKRSVKLKDGKKETVYAPYMVATVVVLPMDKFENIEINTGKLVSDGSNQIITFASLPGLEESLNMGKDIIDLPDHLEIEADVTEFEMMPIVLTATSEIPEVNGLDSAKDLDELIDGIDKIVDASEKLSDATRQLSDGQGELGNGIDELVNGVDQIELGSNSLLDGSLKLKEGVNSAYQGSLKVNQGANTLSKSAEQLGEGFGALGNGTIEFSNKAAEFSQGANKVAKGIETIPESTKALNGGMEELIEGTGNLKNGQDSLTEGLDKSIKALEQIKAGKQKEEKVIGLLLKGMEGLEKIAKGVEALPGGEKLAGAMEAGLAEQRMALEGIANSSGELILALNQVEEGLKEAEGASKQLSVGIENINKGQNEVGGGLNKLTKGTEELDVAAKQLVQGSSGLQKGAGELNKNAVAAKKGAGQFGKGGNELAQGTNGLTKGLGALNGGVGQLYNGVSELSKGSNQLAQGGGKLKEGSQKLVEGSKELNEGMEEFHEEGIKRISDELDGSLDVTKVLEIKDELVEIGKDNNSFTGIDEDMDGSLKIIMKTEGVKGEVKEDKLDIEDEIDESGFINWLKRIFK